MRGSIRVLEEIMNDKKPTSDQEFNKMIGQIGVWRAERLAMVCKAIGLDVGDVAERAAIREFDGGEDCHSAEVNACLDLLSANGDLTEELKGHLTNPKFWHAVYRQGKAHD